ncbi:hypothetical protein ACFQVC_13855 [Streptomyces monticola]|uniref:Uncharacterized protein n=1 Tax=Streptomyces monticola TaxID=2666263 RepID=A0ABW2JGX0_9ACTN
MVRLEPQASPEAGPADRTASAGIASSRPEQNVLPVPLGEGDRQHQESHSEAAFWPAVDDLASHIAAGRYEAVAVILDHAATMADPGETARAMISCRTRGLDEAVEHLLRNASYRDAREIMAIARSLIGAQYPSTAEELLERATAGEQGYRHNAY